MGLRVQGFRAWGLRVWVFRGSTGAAKKQGADSMTRGMQESGAGDTAIIYIYIYLGTGWCLSVSQPPAEVCLTDLAWDYPGV